MALQITKKDAQNAMSRLQGLQRRITSIRERAQETTEKIITTAEVSGAAFAMGVMQGKVGSVEVFGIPAELGLGIGLNAFALLGGAGKHSDHLANVGNGCLAAYATTLGRGVGSTWKAKEAPKQVQASGVGWVDPAMAAAMAGVAR